MYHTRNNKCNFTASKCRRGGIYPGKNNQLTSTRDPFPMPFQIMFGAESFVLPLSGTAVGLSLTPFPT